MEFIFLVPVYCSVISAVASATLLSWLAAVGEPHRRKLMARQLWHLAVADLLFAVSMIILFVFEFFAGAYGWSKVSGAWEDGFSGFCVVSNYAISVGVSVSAIIEAHMSLALVAGVYRSDIAMRLLRISLVCAWPFCLVLSIVNMYLLNMSWAKGICDTKHVHVVYNTVTVVCCLISVTSYVFCLFRVVGAESNGLHVVKKVWSRVHYYLVAWLICILPETLRLLARGSDLAYAKEVTESLLALNGAANTIVYVIQSNYVRRLAMRSRSEIVGRRRPNFDGSFNVTLGGTSFKSEANDMSSHASVASGSESQQSQDVVVQMRQEMTSSFDDNIKHQLLGCLEPEGGS